MSSPLRLSPALCAAFPLSTQMVTEASSSRGGDDPAPAQPQLRRMRNHIPKRRKDSRDISEEQPDDVPISEVGGRLLRPKAAANRKRPRDIGAKTERRLAELERISAQRRQEALEAQTERNLANLERVRLVNSLERVVLDRSETERRLAALERMIAALFDTTRRLAALVHD